MRFFRSLLLFCVSLLPGYAPLYAQTGIIAGKTKAAASIAHVTAYDLFSRDASAINTPIAGLEDVNYLTINREILQHLFANKPSLIAITLPMTDGVHTMVLQRTEIYASDFTARVRTGGGYEEVSMPEGAFYRGYVSGDETSLVALSFFKDELGGIISFSGDNGDYNLVLNADHPGAHGNNYLLFKTTDLDYPAGLLPVCMATKPAVSQHATAKPAKEAGLSCKTVSLALYGDYKLYLKNGSSVAGTQNYLTVLFNGIAAVYENDGVRLSLKQLNVHAVNDFYPTASSHDILYEFGNEIGTDVTADLMQLVTGYTESSGGGMWAPLGGVAWLDVLCETPWYYADWETYIGPYSVINTVGNPAIPSLPVYSWDINCATHELGHNLGSPHTHSCYWNGDNTAIDGCGPTADSSYGDFDCPVGPIPSGLAKGTIMSYCHLLGSVGVSLANGFGPQPAALIRDRVSESDCLLPEYVPIDVLDQPDSTIVANAFCIDGPYLYCYNNQNDFNRSNDQLVLVIANTGIASLNLNLVNIRMSNTAIYASGTATDASGSLYVADAYENWFTANRSWKINLNQALSGETYYVFPFREADINDLQGAYPSFAGQLDSVLWVTYKSQAAANLPESAMPEAVQLYTRGAGAANWLYESVAYRQATIRSTTPVYGATFAVGKKLSPATIVSFTENNGLRLFPNPAKETLQVQLSQENQNIFSIEVRDYLGNLVLRTSAHGNSQLLDVCHLAAGMYLLQCHTSKGVYTGRFIRH